MLIKDVMTKNPITVAPECNVMEAKDLMTKHDINKLPVVNKSGSLVGIITKNDLVKCSPSSATTLDMYELSYLLSKMTVEKTMHKKVQTVTENETVENAAQKMIDYEIGCLPVMKEDLLVGIITESDLFSTFTEMFATKTKGVRATIIMDEKPGQLATLTKAIADKGGNLTSLVTSDGADKDHRRVTFKASNISLNEVSDILKADQITVEDIRNM